jgi:ribonuclease HIII
MSENSKSPLPNTFVATIDVALSGKLLTDLKQQGFEITKPPYTVFSAKKKGVSCTLYQSGKLTVQGKDMRQFLEFYLEPEILGSFQYTYQDLNLDTTARIGIDESGKGDFFGPLCIAGVFAGGEEIAKLKAIGVKDSKTLTDATILKIGSKIQAEFVHHIVKINPQKYNELYKQFGNLNHLLAWGHATTIEQLVLKSGCRKVIIDQFAAEHTVITALKRKKLEVDLTQRHRAEEDLVVAAASILARQTFLEGLEKLGKEFAMEIPKGASAKTIKAGQKIVSKFGKEALEKAAKLHFKTLDAILGKTPE